MATKRKAVKKAPTKKELIIKDGTYLTFKEDGVQEVGWIKVYNDNDNGSVALEIELLYSYEDGTICDFDEVKSMKDLFSQMKVLGATDIQIITKAQADKLAKQLKALEFSTGDYSAVPYKRGKEEGYIFGCGKVELTNQEIIDYLSIRKKMMPQDTTKEKGYSNYATVRDELEAEDSEVTDKTVLELCKRFGIK